MGSNRRRSRASWWNQEVGGAPYWLIAGGLALLIVIGSVGVIGYSRPAPEPFTAPLSDPLIEPPEAGVDAEPVASIAFPEGRPLSVIFLGDSLTGNLYASSEAAGFRALVADGLAQYGPVENNQANRIHATTSEVFEGAPLGENHDVAVIQLGTNDVGRSVPVDEFRLDYRDTLAAFRQSSPAVQMVCLGTWQAPVAGGAYDDIIEEECEAQDGIYRALHDLATDAAMVGPAGKVDVVQGPSDNFHPNDEGHAAIAQRVLDSLEFS